MLWAVRSTRRLFSRISCTKTVQPTATDVVPWSACLCVCPLGTTVSPAKTAEPIEVPFGADFHGPNEQWTTRRCTMAPLAENDWRICTSAAMRSVVTITVATCSTYLRLTVLLFYFYLVCGREAVYCNVQLWVCPSACLSFVCPLIYLRNHTSKLYQILKSMHITRGHGSVFL